MNLCLREMLASASGEVRSHFSRLSATFHTAAPITRIVHHGEYYDSGKATPVATRMVAIMCSMVKESS